MRLIRAGKGSAKRTAAISVPARPPPIFRKPMKALAEPARRRASASAPVGAPGTGREKPTRRNADKGKTRPGPPPGAGWGAGRRPGQNPAEADAEAPLGADVGPAGGRKVPQPHRHDDGSDDNDRHPERHQPHGL